MQPQVWFPLPSWMQAQRTRARNLQCQTQWSLPCVPLNLLASGWTIWFLHWGWSKNLRSANAPANTGQSDISRITAFFCGKPRQLHSSKEALSQVSGCAPQRLEPSLSLLASTLLHVDAAERVAFEEALSENPGQLLAYIELSRQDETPMKVGQKQQASAAGVAALDPIMGPNSETTRRHDVPRANAAASASSASIPATATVTKLFAIENSSLPCSRLRLRIPKGTRPLR